MSILNDHPYQARQTLADTNSDETLFYLLTGTVNKCGRSCNTINDPYA